MKEFFIIIRRPSPAQNMPSAQETQKIAGIWGAFLQGLGQSGKLVHIQQVEYEGKQFVGMNGAVKDLDMNEETVIGWLVVKAEDYDDAVNIARRIPTVEAFGGRCEIRPLMKF